MEPFNIIFGLTLEEYKIARKAAIEAISNYGDEIGVELEFIKAGSINNDHVAMQAAFNAIRLYKGERK